MRTSSRIIFLLLLSSLLPGTLTAENDSIISREEEKKVLLFMKKFQLGLYLDVYSTLDLKNIDDSSQVLPLYANSMHTNDIRLNVVGLIITYRAEKTRANFTLHLGDIPMLLTKVEYQWIKYMRQANFGFKIAKRTWIDLGYFLNPIGVESSWPVYNKLSTASIGGYFEPGNIVGIKISTQFNQKFGTAFYAGNPYSLAYNNDEYGSAGFQLIYTPVSNLGIYYANLAGFQTRKEGSSKFQLYNNFIVDYTPVKQINLVLQYDFAFQTNSHLGPDPSKLSYVNSGFLQATYRPLKWFACSIRGEFFTDPEGYMSGSYMESGSQEGLKTIGYTGGVEFRPIPLIYLRAEYRDIGTNHRIYYNGTAKRQYSLTLTAGLKI